MTVAHLVETVLWCLVRAGGAIHHPGQIAGRAGGSAPGVHNGHSPVPFGQGAGRGGSGQPGADDDGMRAERGGGFGHGKDGPFNRVEIGAVDRAVIMEPVWLAASQSA